MRILADAFKKATEDPKYIEFMKKLHQPIVYRGPEDFLKEVREYDVWATNIMKRVGMMK